MTWLLMSERRVLYRGPYGQALDAAESFELCARSFHLDGTELTPRLAPGVRLVPEDMMPVRRRRAA